jgi:hypothetical protein
VLRGVPTGILQLPWYPIDFEPFTHDHILQIRPEMLDRIGEISTEAERRSGETQLDYLSAFCYTPTVHPECETDSSTKLIAQSLLNKLQTTD